MEQSDMDVVFVSLGMFIIDTIIDVQGNQLNDVIGGAGTYAAIGSRVFTRPGETGFIVDYGSDVPVSVENTLSSLGLALHVRRDKGRLCTRGLNTYSGHLRLFKYLTPKIRITPDQLQPSFLASKAFHLICAPDRCIAIVEELRGLRKQAGITQKPWIIWEPVPDSCIASDVQSFTKAVQNVDIISPNADEAFALLNVVGSEDIDTYREQVEKAAKDIASWGVSTIVIRCSALGSLLHTDERNTWFPALITDQKDVVDATGAGNAFCGALVTRLAQSVSIEDAMVSASVAAGLCIQQVGIPRLQQTADGRETWNGQDVAAFTRDYQSRMHQR